MDALLLVHIEIGEYRSGGGTGRGPGECLQEFTPPDGACPRPENLHQPFIQGFALAGRPVWLLGKLHQPRELHQRRLWLVAECGAEDKRQRVQVIWSGLVRENDGLDSAALMACGQ